ncbi:MAG: ATPase [Nitrospirae bacterium]|nr:ATPase [Nitrospirota bacterium]
MTVPETTPARRATQRTRMVQEVRHDTYKLRGKLKEPTVCRTCGAVFHKGRWTWGKKPAGASATTCAACARTHDRNPAGLLTVKGPYAREHRRELLNLARREERKANSEHPFSRIMTIEEAKDGFVVQTTDTHLARRIGEALHHAHDGTFTFRYREAAALLRAFWKR